MDIQLFIQRRKSLGISQSELCQGICTQATLSRFENQGQVPSVKILLDLCQRLDMSLGELFHVKMSNRLSFINILKRLKMPL